MLDRIKNINFLQERKYAIIGIIIDDTPVYDVLIVHKDGANLSISSSFCTEKFDTVKNKLGSDIPILLNFSGKGIINKKVLSEGNYLKEVLFNASVEDFYIYEVHQGKNVFLSIARKEVLNTFFSQFESEKYHLVDYSIGAIVGTALKKLINQETICTRDSTLIFEKDLLVDFQKKEKAEKSYSLGSEQISSSQVPLFATLLNHLYPLDFISYEFAFLLKNRQELWFKNFFNHAALAIGLFFLISLLASYLLLNHYNNKYVAYESQLYNLNHTYNQVKHLEIEKENKISILRASGMMKQNFLSYYIYRIANSIPENIKLSNLKVNPITKKIKNFEKIVFDTNSVLVQGNTESSLPINIWVKKLKSENWIEKIEIIDFSNSRKSEGRFTLKIVIK